MIAEVSRATCLTSVGEDVDRFLGDPDAGPRSRSLQVGIYDAVLT